MKNFYPDGQAMPKRKGSVEPARSSHAASNQGVIIGRRSIQSPKSVSPFNSYRRRGMVGSPPATSNLYDVLKKVDWLAIFSPWHLINKAKRYTTLLLPTIFVSVFICFSGAAKAQSRQDVGTAEVAKGDTYEKGHRIIPFTSEIELARIRSNPSHDLDLYPMRKYEVNRELITPIKIGDSIPEEVLEMVMWAVSDGNPSDTLSLREYDSSGLLVIDFWARWCAPCVSSMDKCEGLVGEFDGKLQLIGVHMDYDFKAFPFVKERGWKSKSVIGLDAYVLNSYFFDRPVMSRLAWIKDGKLIAITGTDGYDSEIVRRVLEGDTGSLPISYDWTHSNNIQD